MAFSDVPDLAETTFCQKKLNRITAKCNTFTLPVYDMSKCQVQTRVPLGTIFLNHKICVEKEYEMLIHSLMDDTIFQIYVY